jgi:CBS domain containing-hemolysin-like protein
MASLDIATIGRLVAGFVLLLSNGFFVTTEFALTRVRQFSEEEFQGPGLSRAWEMTERLEIFLSGCQVGITVSSVGLGVVAEPALATVMDPILGSLGVVETSGAGHTAAAVIVSFAIINLMHVIIGEQAPTYLGIERTKFVAKYGAPLLYWWTKLMSPVIILSDRVAKALLGLFGVDISRSWTEEELEGEGQPSTRGEVRRQMGDALANVDVTEERREEVINALDIGMIEVSDVMVDREDIVAVSTADDQETNVRRMAGSPHVRFPVIGDSLDDFYGTVYTPDVLDRVRVDGDDPIDFVEMATPPMTVSADMVVSELIDQFQAENQELALVVEDGEADGADGGGRVVGLVTATDAFEQITGDIEDPLDIGKQ